MEYASIAAVAIYGILFVAMVVIILTSIIFNIKAGVKYRKKIAQQLEQLRMSKMLHALGIDTTQYLHKERISEINTQMSRCSECENTDQCDEDMASGNFDPDSISYCNNEESLKAIAEKQKQID